jgi:Phosphoenolpyruvate carboxylase
MADAPDTVLAPIGSVRRTQVGREATEPMREDIRLLGAILGDTVREQNGDEVFDLVERARVGSFRVRRSEIDRAELAELFDGIDVRKAIPVIRAFTHFALLANVAETSTASGGAQSTSRPANRRSAAAWPPPTSNSSPPTWTPTPSPTRSPVRWCHR